jgi:hypothetical protein
MWRPGDDSAMWLVAGATPTTANSVSTTVWSCLMLAGWVICAAPARQLTVVAYFGVGEAADDSSTVLWSVAASSSADEIDRRAAVWGAIVLSNKGV